MKALAISMVGTVLLAVSSFAAADDAAKPAAAADPANVAATQKALRGLWGDHVDTVRAVVKELVKKDAAAADAAEKKVVANAKEIAATIEPFYGKAANEKLFGLLAGHYGAVKAHATATIAGKDTKQALSELTSNAGEIATFLSGANPFLPKDTLVSLLGAHGGHHVQQNQQLAKGDSAAEAKTHAEMTKHIHGIADALGGALAKQFPQKFAKT
jgi:hypothetical protein